MQRNRCSTAFARPVKLPVLFAVLAASCLPVTCTSGDAVAIHDVQGTGGASPLEGRRVRIENAVVTAVGGRGYFIQQPDGATDGDPRTSEALYVYGDAPGDLRPGESVSLDGRVIEFHGHTQITSVTKLRRRGRAPLPAAVDLADPGPEGLEAVESMRVSVADGVLAAATDEHGEVRIAPDGRRPLRLEDSPQLRRLPEMDPDALGGDHRPVAAGERFAAEGVLAFRFGDYVLWPTRLRLAASPPLPRPVRAGGGDELVVATYNLRTLFDDERSGTEPVLEERLFENRLAKHARWLDEILNCPDVVAVQEVEAPGVLERLARESRCDYRAGWDGVAGDLDLGFLFGPGSRPAGEQSLGGALRMPDGAPLFDRPPLLAEIRTPAGAIGLVNVHLRSMRGLGREPRVARKRWLQAEALRDLVAAAASRLDGRVIVLGDFNALPFDDGHGDLLARVAGKELFPAWRKLRRGERYSYVYRGHGQMLDHALVGPGLRPRLVEVAFARGNADAPRDLRDEPGTVLRASDHDPLVIYLRTDGGRSSLRLPMRSPSRTGSPGSSASRQVARPAWNSRITVDPMLNRLISSPRRRHTWPAR